MTVVDGSGGQARGLRGREIAVWSLAALLLFLVPTLARPAHLSSDGYQYLSVAENVVAGRGVATSLVNFDVERAHGVIPAPLTTFPPGFPVATAAVSRIGPALPTAATAVSLLSMTLIVALLGIACNLLAFGPWVARGTILLFLFNAYALRYAGEVFSEPLFTLLFAAAFTLALAAERAERPRAVVLLSLAAGLAAGLSYWVRYAGLLVVAGLGVALGTLLLVRRTRRALLALAATTAAAALPVALGVSRNLRLTGTWQGGNTKHVVHPLREMLKETAQSLWHLVVGDSVSRIARVCAGLFVLAVVYAVIRWRRWPRGPAAGGAFLVAAVTGVYCAMMFYVGQHSVISYAPRMFMPVLPVLLLAAASTIKPPTRTTLASRGVLVAGFVAYAVAGALTFRMPARASGHLEIASRFSPATADGKPLSAWIDAHIGPREPILAAEGQWTGYLLRRPTVSLVGAEYSDTVWTEHDVEGTMDRFGIRYLILFAQAPDGQRESPFLMSLLAGQSDPHLRLAARNDESLIFERAR